MNPILLDIVPWVRQGQCCSQLLAHLALQAAGEENPAFVRSLWGLCQGMAQTGGVCGLLTGGVVTLSYYTGGGEGQAHPEALAILGDYIEWFQGLGPCARGTSCPAISSVLKGVPEDEGVREDIVPDQALCADMLASCWEKIVEILNAYGVDMTEPPARA